MREPSAEFGRVLRARRDEAGLTQAGLAQAVGLSRTAITNIEMGRQSVSLEQLFAFSSALGIRPAELLPEMPPDPPHARALKGESPDVAKWAESVIATGGGRDAAT